MTIIFIFPPIFDSFDFKCELSLEWHFFFLILLKLSQ